MSSVRLPTTCLVRSAPPPGKVVSTSRPCALVKSSCSFGSVKNVSKAFGLKSSSFRVSIMSKTYKVKLIGPKGEEFKFDAPDDTYILDVSESAIVELPYSCRAEHVLLMLGK